MSEPDYSVIANLIWALKCAETDQKKKELLNTAHSLVIGYDSIPSGLLLMQNGATWRAFAQRMSKAPIQIRRVYEIEHPVLETLPGGRARFTFVVTEEEAKALRVAFNVPIQPAPLEATEAMVRATHALAGAAIELTHVLKDGREKQR